jgi:hypothetical protein
MGISAGVGVNEAVFLLQRIAPEKLGNLREELPLIAEDLRIGVMAGEESKASSDQQRDHIVAKARVIEETLCQILIKCDSSTQVAKKKLRESRIIRLCGQIVAVVGSSGVLGALVSTQNTLAAFSGILALLGSLATVAADYKEKIINGSGISIESLYVEILERRFEAELLLRNLRVALKVGASTDELSSMIADGNSLCYRLNSDTIKVIE